MNLSITDTHNGNHVIQRYIRHTNTGAVMGGKAKKQISNMFQVIRESNPSSSQKRTRYQRGNPHKDLQPTSKSDTPQNRSPPESSRTTISTGDQYLGSTSNTSNYEIILTTNKPRTNQSTHFTMTHQYPTMYPENFTTYSHFRKPEPSQSAHHHAPIKTLMKLLLATYI